MDFSAMGKAWEKQLENGDFHGKIIGKPWENGDLYGKIHHFSWVNQLFLWQFYMERSRIC